MTVEQKFNKMAKQLLEMRGIGPRAFRMQSEHSTTELHPLLGMRRT